MNKRHLRYLHEVFFAMNTSCVLLAFLAEVAHSLMWRFSSMEVWIKRQLYIGQTDFIRGYIAWYVPATVGALCLWGLLRVARRTKLSSKLLFWVAGFVALLAAPAYWLYVAQRLHWWGWYGWSAWPYGLSPFEAVLCTVCAVLFVRGRWPIPLWATAALIALHNLFWYRQGVAFGPYWLVAPLLGFCSAVAWTYYVSDLRRQRGVGV